MSISKFDVDILRSEHRGQGRISPKCRLGANQLEFSWRVPACIQSNKQWILDYKEHWRNIPTSLVVGSRDGIELPENRKLHLGEIETKETEPDLLVASQMNYGEQTDQCITGMYQHGR
jgi:hypothetical protein